MAILPELTFYQYLNQDLISVVIQDWKSLEILMLGTMSKESLTLTLDNNIVYLFTLARQELWLKGEESGIHIKVKEIRVNCNHTNLLILAEYAGNICHTGTRSCFAHQLIKEDDAWIWQDMPQ